MRLLPDIIFNDKKIIVLDEDQKKIAKRQILKSDFYQIFPFTTVGNDSVKNAFSNWEKEIGTYTRRILNKEQLLEGFSPDFMLEELLNRIESTPEHEDEAHTFFSELLMQKGGDLKVTHPSMFMYIQGKPNSNKKIGTYLADLTYQALNEQQINEIRHIFGSGQSETLLDRVVVSLLPKLGTKEYSWEYSMYTKLPLKLLAEDLVYLAEHPQYFLKEINNLFKYYVHYIVSQTSIKMNNFETATWDKPSKLFYTLNHESTITSRRKTTSSGMGLLASASENLFAHELTLAQLSCNSNNKSLNEKPTRIMTYDEIYEQFKVLDDISKEKFLDDVDTQVERILKYSGLEEQTIKSQNYNEAVKQLFVTMKKITPDAPQKRYGENVKSIAKSHFTKRRGRLGHVLSLNQEMLILLCAVSCKNDRITFVELIERLSHRGLNFDNETKAVLLILLERINVIDKKSDSGEAQYVKPIL